MATNQIAIENVKKEKCSICQKEPGTCICTGCKNLFCRKDFQNHFQWLSGEFEKVIESRDQLQEQMNNKKRILASRANLLSQIHQWENVTLKKVHRAADRTRDYTEQFLNEKEEHMKNEFDNITKQLCHRQYMENINENDITEFKNKIDSLEKLFEQLTSDSALVIHTEESEKIDWALIIYADEESEQDKKIDVPCLFAGAKCSWVGKRDQLYGHLINSSCGTVRMKLNKFNLLNEQLNEQIRIQKKCIDQQELEIQHQLRENDLLKGQIKKHIIQIDNNEQKIRQITQETMEFKDTLHSKITENQQLSAKLAECKRNIISNEIQFREAKEYEWYYKVALGIAVVILIISLSFIIYVWNSNIAYETQQNERLDKCRAEIQQIIQQANEWESLTNSKITENQQLSTELTECRTETASIENQLVEKQNRWKSLTTSENIENQELNTTLVKCRIEIISIADRLSEEQNEWKHLINSKTMKNRRLNTELEKCRIEIVSIRDQLFEEQSGKWNSKILWPLLVTRMINLLWSIHSMVFFMIIIVLFLFPMIYYA